MANLQGRQPHATLVMVAVLSLALIGLTVFAMSLILGALTSGSTPLPTVADPQGLAETATADTKDPADHQFHPVNEEPPTAGPTASPMLTVAQPTLTSPATRRVNAPPSTTPWPPTMTPTPSSPQAPTPATPVDTSAPPPPPEDTSAPPPVTDTSAPPPAGLIGPDSFRAAASHRQARTQRQGSLSLADPEVSILEPARSPAIRGFSRPFRDQVRRAVGGDEPSRPHRWPVLQQRRGRFRARGSAALTVPILGVEVPTKERFEQMGDGEVGCGDDGL